MFCIDMGKLTNLYQLEKGGFAYLSRDNMFEIHEKIDFKFHCIRDIELNNKIIIQYCTSMSDGVKGKKLIASTSKNWFTRYPSLKNMKTIFQNPKFRKSRKYEITR